MTKNDINNLSGAAALNALNETEQAAYEQLLRDSDEARNESIELQDTAVLLGLAVEPVTPPPSMRASLLAQIAVTPQLGVTPVESIVDAAPAVDAPVSAETKTAAERKAEARWFQRPAFAIASVAAAIALIAGGISTVSNFGSDQNPSVEASALEQLTLASDKQEVVADVEGGGTATLIYSEKLGSSAISMEAANDLALDKVYQLWYIGDDGPRSAGIVPAEGCECTFQLLDGTMQPGDVVGVTVEPTGGSDQPTTTPIVVIAS